MINDKNRHPEEIAKDIVDIMELLDYDEKILFMRSIIRGMAQEASKY